MRQGAAMLVAALCLVSLPALCSAQMGDGLGLEELGLGDLGGMGGLGALGLLGGLGGGGGLGGLAGLGGAMQAAAPAAAPTVIVAQPAMVAAGNFLFVAYNGIVTKYDIATMRRISSATYPTPALTPGTGPATIPGAAPGGGQAPTTLPGLNAPSNLQLQGASEGPTLIEDSEDEDKPPLVPGAAPASGP